MVQIGCAALLLALASASVQAESNRVDTGRVKATLVSEVTEIAPNSSFWVGLRLKVKPGWHTYWLNPGDSGLATSIGWTLPEGLAAGAIRWPIPHRFRFGHLVNYGYDDEVVLLTRMSAWPPIAAASSVEIGADARWLVCKDVCVMEQGQLKLALPIATAAPVKDPEWQDLIAKYERLLPVPARESAEFQVTRDSILLRVRLPLDWSGQPSDVWFYPNDFGIIDYAAPQSANVDGKHVELTLTRGELKHERIERLRGVLVLRFGSDDGRGIYISAQPG